MRSPSAVFPLQPEKPASLSQLISISRANAGLGAGLRALCRPGPLVWARGQARPGQPFWKEFVMANRNRATLGVIALGLAIISSAGCAGVAGPNLGVFGVPIPVSPYFQDKKEDEFWEKERYDRAPVLGPLTANSPTEALDPPSDDEVMRTLERAHPVE